MSVTSDQLQARGRNSQASLKQCWGSCVGPLICTELAMDGEGGERARRYSMTRAPSTDRTE
eukprot:13047621-Alexandrium_andersonii.AAC.1